ncbi:MAG TPA: hypothetical protein VK166_05425, partial [Chitinophagaceae bacterium]|nr:hypothetical protein [Chitinophagaceae bacterium]
MVSKAKAPLRLGLAGGGTDVSPYCDLFGGEVVNAAISLYAYASVTSIKEELIIFRHEDLEPVQYTLTSHILPRGDQYDLHAGVLNRFLKEYGDLDRGINLATKVDVEMGSGLGTSSTLIVAMLGALLEYKGISLDKKEIAALACSIERHDLQHVGGKQDQY